MQLKKLNPFKKKMVFFADAQIAADGFEYKGAEKNSTAIEYATASAIAGVLASFIGGPVGGKILGVLVSVGGYYLSLEAKRAYWITKTYTKEDRPSDYYAILTIRKDHHYYKYHDYTEFIDTASTIQVVQPYRCGPVEEYN